MPLIDIYADSRGLGHCRSCGSAIEWAELVRSGKRMPFDRPLVTVRTQGDILGGGRVTETVDTGVSSSHFETCPDAKTWRRR
jgi:hypothetical protein